MNMKHWLTFLLLPALQLVSAQSVVFTDISKSTGFNATGSSRGIAIGDFDGDGWEDIYVSRTDKPNLLYRNNGDLTFTEVAAAAGVAHGGKTVASLFLDLDNDGDEDLYLTNRDEQDILYENIGNGQFVDISAKAGITNKGWANSLNAADVNGDGYLDIYVANLNQENALYVNNGDMTFTNKILESGATDPSISMGAIFFDYDKDNDPDLYLTHDANIPYILYRNDGKGKFTDVSVQSKANYKGMGMGADIADFNHDSWPDIYITNLFENTLYLNNGNGTFTDVSASAGIQDKGMGWGVTWLDCDNDTWTDVYVTNDTYFSPYPNVLYQNLGNGKFKNVSAGTPLSSPYAGYGNAHADLNGDGWQDLLVANNGADGNQFFLNGESGISDNHWISFKLIGTKSNRNAVGARMEIISSGVRQYDEVVCGSGYVSQSTLNLHFGLGTAQKVELAKVFWPDGSVQYLSNLAADKHYEVEQSGSVTAARDNLLEQSVQLAFNNPAGTRLDVKLYSGAELEAGWRIFDALGNLVFERNPRTLPVGNWQEQIPLAPDWPQGLYVLQLYSDRGTISRKFIVAR